jgi:biotin transport system substrate-specific component
MFIRGNEIAVKATPKAAEYAVLALLFAALTGIGGLIRIPLSPVPMTMQVFFVLLSGLCLGPVWGPASQLTYLLMGLSGAPFFAAAPYAGPGVLFGPTGGYLWGFILASGLVGLASYRLREGVRENSWKLTPGLVLTNLAAIVVIYIAGTSWLSFWLGFNGRNLSLAFTLGVKPFVLIDGIKAMAAAVIGIGLIRKGYGYGR